MEKQYYETVDVRTGSLPLSPTDRTISEIVPVITNGDDCIQSAYYNFSFRHWANLSGELLDVTHWLRPVNLSQDKCYIIFNDDKVNSILSAALQNLSTEQLEVLRDCLIERTPKKVNLSNHDREATTTPVNGDKQEAKEKAKAIVNEFYQPLGNLACNCSPQDMWEYAKARALYHVDEILITLNHQNPNFEDNTYWSPVDYWKQVKEQITNL